MTEPYVKMVIPIPEHIYDQVDDIHKAVLVCLDAVTTDMCVMDDVKKEEILMRYDLLYNKLSHNDIMDLVKYSLNLTPTITSAFIQYASYDVETPTCRIFVYYPIIINGIREVVGRVGNRLNNVIDIITNNVKRNSEATNIDIHASIYDLEKMEYREINNVIYVKVNPDLYDYIKSVIANLKTKGVVGTLKTNHSDVRSIFEIVYNFTVKTNTTIDANGPIKFNGDNAFIIKTLLK